MNQKIIAELNNRISELITAFNHYKIHNFIYNIRKYENVIQYVYSKNYEFLSVEEAIASVRSF